MGRGRTPSSPPAPRGSAGAGWLLLAIPPLGWLAVWPASRDPYETVKFAVLVTGAACWAALAARDAVRRGVVRVHASPWGVALAVVLSVALLAALLGPAPPSSLFGVRARHTGWLTMAASGVVGMGMAGAASRAVAQRWTTVLLAGASVLGAYGLIQMGGWEPLAVQGQVGGVFATLANPNFAGGLAGSLAGLAAWQASARRVSGWRRGLALLAGAGVVVVVLGAGSVVGYVALLASLATMVAALLGVRGGAVARVGVPLTGVVAAAGAAVVGLGVVERGPLAVLGASRGVQLRRGYWDAALSMAADHPLLGVGLDRFEAFHRAHRSPVAARLVAAELEVDNAHSVVLHLLAGGGVPLALAHLALIAATVWAAWRLLRPEHGEARLLHAAVASVWVGLTVQSLASFAVPALHVTSVATAGLLAGLAWPGRAAAWRLPGYPAPALSDGGPGRASTRRAQSDPPVWAWPVGAVAGLVLATSGIVVATVPLRAELQAQQAAQAGAQGAHATAVSHWLAAGRIAPWVAEYPYQRGLSLLAADQLGAAEDAMQDALAAEPRHVPARVTLGRVQSALGHLDEAADTYAVVLRHEPHHPVLVAEAAAALQAAGREAPEVGDG